MRTSGSADDGLEQDLKMAHHPRDGLGQEQLGAIGEAQVQAVVALANIKGQIELGLETFLQAALGLQARRAAPTRPQSSES